MKENVCGGFIIPSEYLDGKIFVLTVQWDESFKDYFDSGKAEGIRLSRSAGWKVESLEFLSELKMLKSIEIYNANIKDISVLSSFTALLHLGLECPYKPFDFSVLDHLQVLMLNWRKGAESLFSVDSLRYLNVSGYPERGLSPLASLKNLSRLYIQSRKLESVDGIENLGSLTRLELAYCPFLTDISGLERISSLENLMLYSCKKITNIDDLNNCQNLKYLNVECNNGILDSVNVLVHCLELKELLLIGIKIKDGDLSPILTLKNLHNLAIANYKYHKPSVDELKIALNL